MRHALPAAAATLLLVAASGCGQAHRAGTPTAAAQAERRSTALAPPSGPLGATRRWRGGVAPVGALLFDDGRRLWSVPLDGPRTLLWTHPRLVATGLAAGPGGRGVALAGEATPSGTTAPAAFLYLLTPDGAVRTVDTVAAGGTIAAPAFQRAPTDPLGPVHLYWIRELDASKYVPRRPWDWKQVWLLNGSSRVHVDVHLRLNEYPYELHGYAGSPLFSLTTFRRDNSPTREEVLLDGDAQGDAFSALDSLAQLEPLVNTDVADSAAWPNPRDLVVAVGQAAHPAGFALRLYRAGCQYEGSHLVRAARGFDLSPQSRAWPLLAGGPHRVLVVGDGKGLERGVWTAIDIRNGNATATRATWATGAWTFVQPSLDAAAIAQSAPGCGAYAWQYP